MTGALPPGLEGAFRLAAGELGMTSAAWLFARELLAGGGPALVEALRTELGNRFAVVDAVCARALSGHPEPRPSPAAALSALLGAGRVLVVGIEALWLDPLVDALVAGGARVGLLLDPSLEADPDRVLANFPVGVDLATLDGFAAWSGARSAILTFTYGGQAPGRLNALPAWLRVHGPDMRTRFRALVAWETLAGPLAVHPRWLVEAPTLDFSTVVPAAEAPP